MIYMLGWPDGARVRGVAYLPPVGTDPSAWRSLLVGKYGAPSRDSDSMDGDGLHAQWCGQAACLGEGGLFRLGADVGMRGSQIVLSQSEGTAAKVTVLIEQDASRRGPHERPAL